MKRPPETPTHKAMGTVAPNHITGLHGFDLARELRIDPFGLDRHRVGGAGGRVDLKVDRA
jgi:hypothetical protein